MSTQNTPEIARLGELTTEQFRQKLAGILDPQEMQTPERREEVRGLAIAFTSALPMVFSDDLDRKTMWDRIGTGLQSAFAKTAGGDYEYFVNEVLGHILAGGAAAASCEPIRKVLETLGEWSVSDRQAWIVYFRTHLIPILVHAKAAWEGHKTAAKVKRASKADPPKRSPNAMDSSTTDSFALPFDEGEDQ